MKIFLMIMTYDERENISPLIRKIKELSIDNLRIVIIDDSSPDGTADAVREMIEELHGIDLLIRRENRGRAGAERVGFKYCLKEGADIILEMDADFSHDPGMIPEFLEAVKNNDIVVGSRFIKGGSITRAGIIRNFITWCAARYIRYVLGLNVMDPTSGFRCFKSEVLKAINLESSISDGFAFLQEILYKAHRLGFSIGEIPIKFVDRTRGASKFPMVSVTQGLLMMLVFRILFARVRQPESTEIFRSRDTEISDQEHDTHPVPGGKD